MGLKQRITFTVMGALLVGAVVNMAVSLGLVWEFFPGWVEDTEAAMLATEVGNLQRTARSKAAFASLFFARIDSLVEVAADYETQTINNRVGATERPASQHWDTSARTFNPALAVPGYTSSTSPARSTQVAGWWYCGGGISDACGGVTSPTDLPAATLDRLQKSAAMEVGYRAVESAGFPLGGSIQGVGYESDGLFITHPWQVSTYHTWEGTCSANGLPKQGYDPRCRGWYTDAKELPRQTFFTAPYFFASEPPTMGLTASRALFDADDFNVKAVFLGDFVLDEVVDNVVDTKILDNGYGMLFTRLRTTVAHPAFDLATSTVAPTIAQAEILDTDVGTNAEMQAFDDIIATFTLSTDAASSTTYSKGDELQHLALRKVTGSDFSLGITVPDSDVRRPFLDAKDSIITALIIVICITVAVASLLACAATVFAGTVAGRVVRPVQLLLEATRRINRGDYSQAMPKMGSDTCRELLVLHEVFRRMVLVVRFGNTSFMSGDLDAALATFQDALELFTSMGNKRGVGVAHNNIGAVYMRQGKHELAADALAQACLISEELLAEASGAAVPGGGGGTTAVAVDVGASAGAGAGAAAGATAGVDKVDELRETVVNRLRNLGQAYAALKNGPELRRTMLRAVDLASNNPDLTHRVVTTYVELATFEIDEGNYAAADEAAVQARNAVLAHPASVEPAVPLGIMLQRVLAVQAASAAAQGSHLFAVKLYGDCLDSYHMVESVIEGRCRAGMAKSLKELGMTDEADVVRNMFREKDLLFCLDCSGSMAGGRMREALRNLLWIYDEFLHKGDSVGFVKFNSRVEVVIDVQGVDRPSGNRARLRGLLDARAGGQTAFYDALMACKQLLDARDGSQTSWVVALTDGEDNKSRHTPHQVRDAFTGTTYNIVLIGLGRLANEDQLRMITAATPKGKFIAAHGGDVEALKDAFQQVADVITEDAALTLEF